MIPPALFSLWSLASIIAEARLGRPPASFPPAALARSLAFATQGGLAAWLCVHGTPWAGVGLFLTLFVLALVPAAPAAPAEGHKPPKSEADGSQDGVPE